MVSVAADSLENLFKEDKLQLYKFLDECVNDIVGRECQRNEEPKINGELNETKSFIKNFYRTAIIEKKYEPDPSLSDNVKEAVETCFNVRKNEIYQALVKEHVLKNGHNVVENFDWRLRWILGSSSLATIKEPRLQIDLYCVRQENGVIKHEIVNFEANLEKVDELIQALSEIKKELESL